MLGDNLGKMTSRDWRALKIALFTVSLIISALLGLNAAFLGWIDYKNKWTSTERSIAYFNDQVGASLSVMEYGTAAALAGAFLKREDVDGVVIYDQYDFQVAAIGIPPKKAASDGKHIIYRSSEGFKDNYSIIVLKKPDYAALVFKVLMQSAITCFISFMVLRLLLADIVQRYFATPLKKLANAMDLTRQSGRHVEVKMPTDTEIGYLAEIFNEMQRESSRRNEELKLALQRAASASKAKSAFLANMSHELRSPLNAIIGFSQMLLYRDQFIRGDKEAKITEYASSIESGGRHLLEIVNSVLDLKRIENGIFTINPVHVSAKELKEEIVHLVDAKDSRRWLKIKHVSADGNGTIFADSTVLKQVLINFICNARSHNPKGTKVEVIITTRAQSCEISVTDNGVGMAEDEVALALQPFARLSNPMVADSGGSGLGLPISRALILQHGGTFRIKSKISKGTQILFTLPGENVAKIVKGEIQQAQDMSPVAA